MSELARLSQRLGECLLAHNQVIATAESCTGGGISAAITDIAGSSAWFDRAFITYSNEAKMEMLGVKANTLTQHGAVSEAVVSQMAQGALQHSNATIAIAVSGIAGPGGGSVDKPVGTVCITWAFANGDKELTTLHFNGDRQQVRQQVVMYALSHLHEKLAACS